MTTAETTRPSTAAAAAPTGSAELAALPTRPPSSDTPRRLRRYQLVSAVALLVFGLISVVQLGQLRTELAAAPALGTQHVLLGEVSATVSAAGNRAAADVLAGSGSDQSAQLLQTAAGLLVEAAAADPAQASAIAAINADLVHYGQLLAAAQIDQADQLFDSSLQPALTALSQVLSGRAAQSTWWTSPLVTLALGLIVLIAACWLSYQVAQRSHRVLNSGVLAAIAATIAITALTIGGAPVSGGAGLSSGSIVQASSQLTAAQLQADSASRVLLDAAQQKTWDKAVQQTYAKADQQAADGFTDEASDLYGKLQASRKSVTAALAGGNWAKASALLADNGAVATAEAALTEGVAQQRSGLSASATSGSGSTSLLLWFEAGAAALALAGAFLAVRGLQTRIEEYR